MTIRRAVTVLALCAMSSFAACSDSTEAKATPQWVPVILATPNTDDGGVMFSITGAQVDSVRSSHPIAFARHAGDTLRVVISGALSAGEIGQVWMADSRAAARATLKVEQIAVRVTFAQRGVGGYTIALEPR